MLPVYLAAFAFGVVLIGASVLFGGQELDHDADGGLDAEVEIDHDLGELDHEVDFDGDVDHDLDAILDADAEGELHGFQGKDLELAAAGDAANLLVFNPLLSLRFWTYFAASFGGVGALLTLLHFAPAVHIPAASIMGLGIGYAAAAVFRAFKKRPVSTELRGASLVGGEALVMLEVRPDKPGKVQALLAGSVVEFKAVSHEEIPRGAPALVIDLEGHTATVIRMPRLEDLSPKETVEVRRRLAKRARERKDRA